MRIRAAAEKMGVSPDTLRRLEKRGVVSFVRDWNGQRRITSQDLKKLRTILFPDTRRQTHRRRSG